MQSAESHQWDKVEDHVGKACTTTCYKQFARLDI